MGVARVGVIVRDGMGKVLASMCMSLLYIIDPTIVEACAIWSKIFFGRNLGQQNVILEGNALEIVNVFLLEG